jgi:hypothetical protein
VTRAVRPVPALLTDALFVLLFAAVGRASHGEGVTAEGVWAVAWPFLLGLAAGWAIAGTRHPWPTGRRGSAVVWLSTAGLGLVARVLTGGGFAWSFGLVTFVVLGVFLLGWRLLMRAVRPVKRV